MKARVMVLVTLMAAAGGAEQPSPATAVLDGAHVSLQARLSGDFTDPRCWTNCEPGSEIQVLSENDPDRRKVATRTKFTLLKNGNGNLQVSIQGLPADYPAETKNLETPAPPAKGTDKELPDRIALKVGDRSFDCSVFERVSAVPEGKPGSLVRLTVWWTADATTQGGILKVLQTLEEESDSGVRILKSSELKLTDLVAKAQVDGAELECYGVEVLEKSGDDVTREAKQLRKDTIPGSLVESRERVRSAAGKPWTETLARIERMSILRRATIEKDK